VGRKSVVVQEIGIMCDDDPSVFPCGGKYIFIASSAKAEISDKLGVVARALQNFRHFDARVLVDKKLHLAPILPI